MPQWSAKGCYVAHQNFCWCLLSFSESGLDLCKAGLVTSYSPSNEKGFFGYNSCRSPWRLRRPSKHPGLWSHSPYRLPFFLFPLSFLCYFPWASLLFSSFLFFLQLFYEVRKDILPLHYLLQQLFWDASHHVFQNSQSAYRHKSLKQNYFNLVII